MIQQLLIEKFGNCKYADSGCIGSYENTREAEFRVYDPPSELEEPVRIVTSTDEHQLIVSNVNATEICLVKTDKCLFTHTTSKCDCLLFNSVKLFFVEIKTSSIKTRSEHRHTAIQQLGATINLLKSEGIDFTTLETKAIICFKSMKPYITRASLNSQRAIFQEKHSVSLEEGNNIVF